MLGLNIHINELLQLGSAIVKPVCKFVVKCSNKLDKHV